MTSDVKRAPHVMEETTLCGGTNAEDKPVHG